MNIRKAPWSLGEKRTGGPRNWGSPGRLLTGDAAEKAGLRALVQPWVPAISCSRRHSTCHNCDWVTVV